MLFVIAVGATIVGLAASSRDALLAGVVSGIGAAVLIVVGASRSGARQRHRDG